MDTVEPVGCEAETSRISPIQIREDDAKELSWETEELAGALRRLEAD